LSGRREFGRILLADDRRGVFRCRSSGMRERICGDDRRAGDRRCAMGKKHRAAILGLLALAAMFAAMLTACWNAEKPLLFTITFHDARGLQVGDPLVCRGVRIGEVKKLTLDPGGTVRVDVRVSREHSSIVYREAEFVIEKHEGAGRSGGKQVTMKDRKGGERHPIQANEVVDGANDVLDRLRDLAQEFSTSALKGLEAARDRLSEKMDTLRDSPEGKKLLEDIQSYAEQVRRLGKERLQGIRGQQLTEIKERAERLKQQLVSQGAEEKARDFWDSFREWYELATKPHVDPRAGQPTPKP
jgi:hypothetical protein